MNHQYHKTIQARFSAAAKSYDQYAAVQSRAAAATLERLDPEIIPRRILELGCGSGQLTRLLLHRFPEIEMDAVDISNSMLHVALQNMPGPNKVHFLLGDMLTVQLHSAYGLVVSSSALHWVPDLPAGCRRIHDHLEPGGSFVASIMLVDTLAELHASRLAVAPHKPVAARLPRPDEIVTILSDAGFSYIDHAEEQVLSHYPSAHDFLREIHELGLTGGAVSRSRVPLNRCELNALQDHYNEQYGRDDGQVHATYHLGYFSAVK